MADIATSPKRGLTMGSMAMTIQNQPQCSFLSFLASKPFRFSVLTAHRSYRYDVMSDGTFENRKIFAFVDSGVPDGEDLIFRMLYVAFPSDCCQQASIATPRGMCTRDAETVFRYGTPPGNCWARSTWVWEPQTFSSRVTGV